MAWGLALLSPPASEPVTLAEAKAWLRVDIGDDDALIQSLVSAARQHVEDVLGRQLVQAQWMLSLDCFPGGTPGWASLVGPALAGTPGGGAGSGWALRAVSLPKSPLVSVQSVQYLDQAGALQTLDPSGYDVDAASDPGRVSLAQYRYWPITRIAPGAVRISFTAGYASVPEAIKAAIKMLAASWYENREAVVTGTIASKIPLAVESLLASQSNGEYR